MTHDPAVAPATAGPETDGDRRMLLVWEAWAKHEGNKGAASLFRRSADRLDALTVERNRWHGKWKAAHEGAEVGLDDLRARVATLEARTAEDALLLAQYKQTLIDVQRHATEGQRRDEERIAGLEARLRDAERKAEAYDRINTPEIDDFLSAVKNEALHQRERWGVDHDGGKEASDWFWLVGYLAGKALHDVKGKRLHHLITTGAALLNWHAHAIGAYAQMRPGIEPPDPETANA